MDKNRLRDAARNNIVTIMFIVLCAVCMVFSGYAPNYVLYELFGRLSRNMFIVLSLIIPIVAGMGWSVETSIMINVAANGLVNLFTPTCGFIMGGLALARVPYESWLKWAWKLLLTLFVVVGVVLTIAMAVLS